MQRRKNMIELKCPNCRADIELDDSREVGFCRYCGTQILIEPNKSKIDGIAGVDNLLLRAEQFLKENDIRKAKEYYNRVLDIDIHNEKALKGLDAITKPAIQPVDKEPTIFVEELKKKELEEQRKVQEAVAKYEYQMVQFIVNAIKERCKSSNHLVEGIVKYYSGDWHDSCSIISCSKSDMKRYIPSADNVYTKTGLLKPSTNIQLFSKLLKEEVDLCGFTHFDFQLIPYEGKEQAGATLFGGTKWKRLGTYYDVWIKVTW